MTTFEECTQIIIRLGRVQEELAEAQKETDKQLKETDKQLKQTNQEIKKLSKYIGAIGSNQGDVAEEFFANSIAATLEVGGIKYDTFEQNVHKRTKEAEGEFDAILANGSDIAIIETKYKAHKSDLENLLQKKYENFKKLYPQYSNYVHHLGLASFHINSDLKEEALKNNVMVLQRKGDIIETTLPQE